MTTGRPEPGDWLGGGENVRGKDMIALHHDAEMFVGAMVLDGVLERHRGLRFGVIELGAGWVPAMLRRLDHIAAIWQRSEPELAALTRPPSQQITEQMGFTPYPFEDVGALIRESNDQLYLFSSDYPHVEGGRNPIGRFEASLGDVPEATRDAFYRGNLARLIDA
jgi:predicted TIM-barrel fold metal-dependent hydrolase